MSGTEPNSSPSYAREVARRALAEKEQAAVDEIRRLLDAGIEVLSTTETARVADIVKTAGLSNSAFYRYFESKDELIAAILLDGANRMASYLAHRTAKFEDPAEQVGEWVRGVMDQAQVPHLASPTRALLTQGHRLPRAKNSSSSPDLMRVSLIPALGNLGSEDPDRDSIFIAELVTAMLMRHLEFDAPPTDREVEDLIVFVLRAVSA